mgnify:CR=1 FL=1|jgi:hypothetical protein
MCPWTWSSLQAFFYLALHRECQLLPVTLYFLMPCNYVRVMLLRPHMQAHKTADGLEIQAEAPEM